MKNGKEIKINEEIWNELRDEMKTMEIRKERIQHSEK